MGVLKVQPPKNFSLFKEQELVVLCFEAFGTACKLNFRPWIRLITNLQVKKLSHGFIALKSDTQDICLKAGYQKSTRQQVNIL